MKEEICIVLLSILICSLAFNLSCPEPGQWNYRATAYCFGNLNKYTCLLDTSKTQYIETCDGPRVEIEGHKSAINRNNFDTTKCRPTRYQDLDFITIGNSDCVFKKSKCEQEGQIVSSITDHSSLKDIQCRCDHTKGYSFISLPRDKCYCNPTAEDCSCYRQLCPSGKILSPDYQCMTVINMTAGHWTCSNLSVPVSRSDGDRITRRDLYMAEDDLKIGNKNRNAAAVTVMLLTLIMICILICCLEKHVFDKIEENIRKLNTFIRQTNFDNPNIDVNLKKDSAFGTSFESGEHAEDDSNVNSVPVAVNMDVEPSPLAGHDQNVNPVPVLVNMDVEPSPLAGHDQNVNSVPVAVNMDVEPSPLAGHDQNVNPVPVAVNMDVEPSPLAGHDQNVNPVPVAVNMDVEPSPLADHDQNVNHKAVESDNLSEDSFHSFDNSNEDENPKDATDGSKIEGTNSNDNEFTTDKTSTTTNIIISDDTAENSAKTENVTKRDKEYDGCELTTDKSGTATNAINLDDTAENSEKTENDTERDKESNGCELTTDKPSTATNVISLDDTAENSEKTENDTVKDKESNGCEVTTDKPSTATNVISLDDTAENSEKTENDTVKDKESNGCEVTTDKPSTATNVISLDDTAENSEKTENDTVKGDKSLSQTKEEECCSNSTERELQINQKFEDLQHFDKISDELTATDENHLTTNVTSPEEPDENAEKT